MSGTSRCDLNGLWKLSALLEALQETANEHCRMLHAGNDDLSAMGLTWVLFKIDLQVDRYPRAGETVAVQTFTKGSSFKFYPRYYVVTDCAGYPVSKAGALWMLMDKSSRNTVTPKECGIVLPNERDAEIPLKISTASNRVEGEAISFPYTPEYTDIDRNGHVNNIRYADLLCNCLGLRIMREQEVSFLTINYGHEILPEMELNNTLIIGGNTFRFTGQTGGIVAFDMFGKLRTRAISRRV